MRPTGSRCVFFSIYLRRDAKSAGWAQLLGWLGAENSMKTIFSTMDVHPRDRFDFWHEVACKNLIDHSSIPQCRQSFEAKIEVGTLGHVKLVLFENSAMDVTHSRKIFRTPKMTICSFAGRSSARFRSNKMGVERF